jgi:hypothetical protein
METEQWNRLAKQYRDKLNKSGKVLQALSTTAYAETARAAYGGDGLPLGLVDQRGDMEDATLEDHLRDIGLDLSATAEGIHYATEDGAESADALALLRQYQEMLQGAQAVLQQLVDLANQHGFSSTSVAVAEW